MMLQHYINWNPNPEIVNLFGVSIRFYGLLFVLGLILSISMLQYLYKQEGLPKSYLDKLTSFGLIGIIVGARLGHCLFYEPAYYLSNPLEMLLPIKILESGGIEVTGYRGLASHGGALGLIIALIIYSRKTKHHLSDALDLLAIVAGLGAGFIRLANLMNSEIIGQPTNVPWAFIFKQVDMLPRHPTQLYEALCYFSIFALMLVLYHTQRALLKHGGAFGLALTLIFTARFFLEFIKEHQVAFENDILLNMGQILSIPYIVIGIVFIFYARKKQAMK
ncbi:prolipoprotein diacylglyceryl transferase [Carboxylicivirga sp. A043]|uniref:prolipoprotein diacylglyceryl transferase n=1 Tax=Carboxylicivirga litoralis TaxID=2816963 RepID=UPI0021CB4BA7|nr:prolipoprotein diacylglyceryl transferase [Carboxylicivirga sp. A043]MCU4155107.1 prolipoprotein diacylglyceryl transferase [Carboxylicivirga sp. A043]